VDVFARCAARMRKACFILSLASILILSHRLLYMKAAIAASICCRVKGRGRPSRQSTGARPKIKVQERRHLQFCPYPVGISRRACTPRSSTPQHGLIDGPQPPRRRPAEPRGNPNLPKGKGRSTALLWTAHPPHSAVGWSRRREQRGAWTSVTQPRWRAVAVGADSPRRREMSQGWLRSKG
jgi:hypothetical protein